MTNDVDQIDFAQGVSSWHVTWPIMDLSKTACKSFGTPRDNIRQRNTEWQLCFVANEQQGHWSSDGFWLHHYGSGNEVAIVRFALCVGDGDPIFEEANIVIFSNPGRTGPYLRLPVKELKPGDRAVVHVWIDLPNAAGKLNKRKWVAFQEVGVAQNGLVRNFAGLLKGVVGEDDDFASFSDVTLVLKKNKEDPGRRFLCHRCVLAARSIVFLRMFANKQWKEGATKDDRIVEITDIDEETMKHMLRFMYTSSLPGKGSNIPNIIYAADKYQLADLKQWCIDKLIFDFNTDTDRLHQLLLADRHQLSQLKAVCIACLTTNMTRFKSKEMRSTLSDDLWAELWTAIAKRLMNTKEIPL